MKLFLATFFSLIIAQSTLAAVTKHQSIQPGHSKCLEAAVEFVTSVFSLDKEAKVVVHRDAKRTASRIDYHKPHGLFQYAVKRIFESSKDVETVEFQGSGALIQIEGTLQRDGKCKVSNRKFRSSTHIK